MATQSGLSFDPDHSATIVGLLFRRGEKHRRLSRFPPLQLMDNSPPTTTTIQFPVCNSADRDDHGKRKVLDEMDFFSDKKDAAGRDEEEGGGIECFMRGHDRLDCKVNVCFIFFFGFLKWFFSYEVLIFFLFRQTGLHLLTTANTGSDESVVEDGMSSLVSDSKRSQNEVRSLNIYQVNTEGNN